MAKSGSKEPTRPKNTGEDPRSKKPVPLPKETSKIITNSVGKYIATEFTPGIKAGSQSGLVPLLNPKTGYPESGQQVKESQRSAAVRNRLELAEKAAAEGNLAAAVAYAKAAQRLQKGGNGLKTSLYNVNQVVSAYNRAYEKVKNSGVDESPGDGVGESPGGGDGNSPSVGDPSNFQGAYGYNPSPPSPVLIPGRDALNFATTGVVNSLTSFIFEELGGTELITLMKRDTIDGIDPDYTVISNISEVRRNMDPISLVSKRTRTESYFDRFAIELLDKIPDDQYLSINKLQDFYYIASNGDLVIELENIAESERIDVDIATSGTINELDTD